MAWNFGMIGLLVLLSYAPFGLACAPHCTKGLIFQDFTGKEPDNPDTPQIDGSSLSCGFSESEQCCWNNEVSPVDKNDFFHVVAPGDLFTCKPGVALVPAGGFMALYTQNPAYLPVRGTAMFASCPITCSIPGSTTDVSMKVWKSVPPKFSVCRRDVKAGGITGPLEECQDATKNTAAVIGAPIETFTFTATEMYQIVIVAEGFIGALDFVGFDDIEVKTTECTTTTTSTTTESTTTESTTTTTTEEPTTSATFAPKDETNICQRIPCSFGYDTCNWKQYGGPESREFKTYQIAEIVGNADTGVNSYILAQPDAGMPKVSETPFVAVQLPGRTRAMMELDELDIPYDVEMRFTAYEACRYNTIKVCFDLQLDVGEPLCQNVTNYDVAIDDRQWKDTKVINVPTGTKAMVIMAENSGTLHCAAGITNFMVRDPTTGAVC